VLNVNFVVANITPVRSLISFPAPVCIHLPPYVVDFYIAGPARLDLDTDFLIAGLID